MKKVIYLHVDDLIFMGTNEKMIEDFIKVIKQEFEMTDLELVKYFLGLEIRQVDFGYFVSQEAYVKDILKKNKMEDCNSVTMPMELGMKLYKFEGGVQVNTVV